MMVGDMRDPELIWRLGRWLARRKTGEIRMSSSHGELVLRVAGGKIVSAAGTERGLLGARLGCQPTGHDDLFAEAVEIAANQELAENQAMAAAKEILQDAFEAWLLDPERRLEIRNVEVDAGAGPTLSATHAVVERVLSSQSEAVTRAVLPDPDVLLRRTDDFLELYSALRLSEEADLIVAKVTGQRTVGEISERSPHGPEEVVNLLAALVAAGMLEPVPIEEPALEREPIPVLASQDDQPARRRLPAWMLLAAIAAVVVVLVLVATQWQRPGSTAEAPEAIGPQWGLVVDMGCEPQELQRVLKKAGQYSDELVPVAAEASEGSPCWRLVWGRFPDRATASGAVGDIPAHLRLEGFTPHPIELPPEGPDGSSASGEE
jgi:hypothetical protein